MRTQCKEQEPKAKFARIGYSCVLPIVILFSGCATSSLDKVTCGSRSSGMDLLSGETKARVLASLGSAGYREVLECVSLGITSAEEACAVQLDVVEFDKLLARDAYQGKPVTFQPRPVEMLAGKLPVQLTVRYSRQYPTAVSVYADEAHSHAVVFIWFSLCHSLREVI